MMSWLILRSTTERILRQLRHDHRTLALVVVMPVLLLTLMYFVWDGQPLFDRIAIVMLGILPFTVMFLLSSIAVLRERTSGTLERLFTTPAGKLDLLFAYAMAFGLAAAVQALVATVYARWVLDVSTAGSLLMILLIASVNAVLGVALGLLCSAFAQSEFQAVQFMPLVVLPQLLLCGLFVERSHMADWLEAVSAAMPLTYSVRALMDVRTDETLNATVWRDLGIVFGSIVLALSIGAVTLRRRTP